MCMEPVARMRFRISIAIALTALSIATALPVCAQRQQPQSPEQRRASHEVDRLFSEEMKMASVKLKWHGERLTEDTIYAVALTGASWEPAWGKETMFSLAWGEMRKIPGLGKKGGPRPTLDLTAANEVRSLYDSRNYRKAVDVAMANYSLDEIGCNVKLKETVGGSLLALGQPEQAFPIFAAPFEGAPAEPRSSENNRKFREAALESALRAGLQKEAVAFSLSLLLDPDSEAPQPDMKQIAYLERIGVDIDRVLLGVLQAPEKLRGLPSYYYAAADLMAFRASPRLFPFLLQLADSSDIYLRSRAILGLGMVAYQARAKDPADWASKIILSQPREFGISAGERKFVEREIREAANSDKYRLRAAAALAMGLTGEADWLPTLQKLAKDKAYLQYAEGGERSKTRKLVFPVRMAAAAALYRFGLDADTGGGVFTGKDLDKAKRGGSDETADHRNLRKDVASVLTVSPADATAAIPFR